MSTVPIEFLTDIVSDRSTHTPGNWSRPDDNNFDCYALSTLSICHPKDYLGLSLSGFVQSCQQPGQLKHTTVSSKKVHKTSVLLWLERSGVFRDSGINGATR